MRLEREAAGGRIVNRRPTLRLGVAAALLVVALCLPIGESTPVHGGRATRPLDPSTGPAPSGPSPRVGGLEPHVLATLGLLNGSVVPGNLAMIEADLPEGVAYDSATGLYYIGYGAPNALAEYNATARTVPRVIPLPYGDPVIVDDPVTHELLVTANTSTLVLGGANLTEVKALSAGNPIEDLTLDPVAQTVFVSLVGLAAVEEFNLTTGAKVRTVSVGPGAAGVAYSADSGDVYVADSGSSNVSVFSASTGASVATIDVGPDPLAVAYDAAARAVVVTHPRGTNVSLISDRNQKFAANVTVGDYLSAVTANPRTEEVYVPNVYGDSVSVVNASTDSIDGTIATGLVSGPDSVGTDASGNRLVIPLLSAQAVAYARAAPPFTLLSSVSLVATPVSVAEDTANQTIYVADFARNEIVGVNETTDRITVNRSVGQGPSSVVYDAVHDRLYVGLRGASYVRVLNASTLANETTLGVGSTPGAMALDPGDHLLFVPSQQSSNVSIIDTSTERVVRSMKTANFAEGVTFDPDNRRIYVVCLSGSVTILDPIHGTYLGNITLRSYGGSIAFDPYTRTVLAQSTEPDHLEVIDPANSSVVYRVPLPLNSYGIGVDTADRELLVGAQGYNLTVLNATSYALVGDVPVGEDPTAVAFSNATDRAYVAGLTSGSLSILGTGSPAPPFITTFVATPDPITVGNSTTLAVIATGDGVLGYSYSGLPNPCTGGNVSTIACTPGRVGNYTVNVTVTDPHGRASVARLLLRVSGLPLMLHGLSIAPVSGASLIVGHTADFSAAATFDDGSNATRFVALSWSVAPPELCRLNASSGPQVNCTAQIVGNGTVTVRATLNGTTLTASSALHVSAPPRVLGSVAVTPPAAAVAINGSIVLNASAFDTYGQSLGNGPTFAWSVWPTALGTLNATSGAVVSFLAGPRAANGTVNVSATWNGVVRTASASINVSALLRELAAATITPAGANVTTNGTSSFSAVAVDTTGHAIAAGPVFSWSFAPLGLGRLTVASGASVTFEAGPVAGNGTLTVTATWNGRTVRDRVPVQVTAGGPGHSSSGPTSSGGSIPLWVWALVAAGVVAAVVAVGTLARRGRRPPPTEPEPSGAIVSAGAAGSDADSAPGAAPTDR